MMLKKKTCHTNKHKHKGGKEAFLWWKVFRPQTNGMGTPIQRGQKTGVFVIEPKQPIKQWTDL